MVTEALLLRDAEKCTGSGDPGLSRLGREQARRAATALARLGPVAVISSPLRRALETAQAVSRSIGVELQIDERLRERMNRPVGMQERVFLRLWREMDLGRGPNAPRPQRRCGGRPSLKARCARPHQ